MSRQPDYGFDIISEAYQKEGIAPVTKGPSTYLHAGASKGWPHDQKAEDTFDVPPITHFRDGTPVPMVTVDTRAEPEPEVFEPAEEYYARYMTTGGAELVLVKSQFSKTIKHVANFSNFADAQTAAEALNNLKGY